MEYSDECCQSTDFLWELRFLIFLWLVDCGDSLPRTIVTVIPSQCSMPCAGNSEEDCGGPWLLTVLQQPSVPIIAPPITVPSFQTWTSLGCYRYYAPSIKKNDKN
jgi:hypothetical protein